MGLLYDDIISEIGRRTDATDNQVRRLFEDAGVKSVQFDNQIYRQAGLAPVDIRQSPAMLQVLNAGYKKTLGNMKNLTLTTANTAQTAYYNACNLAYMKITSGAFSYQEAIKQAIKQTAEQGSTVLYPSGHQDKIDVAVRRAVLTGVGQTCRTISETNASEMDCDLMELSAHSGARPTHAEWQGQIVSLSGRHGYLHKDDIGYGDGGGFGGYNCRHDWYPYFEGISTRNYSKKSLEQMNSKCIEYNGTKYTEYEISQMQRKMEREIRSAKREKVAYKTAVEESSGELKATMQKALTYSTSLVSDKQAKMRDFINQTSQQRDYFREQNYGRVSYSNRLTSDNNRVIINGRGSGTNNKEYQQHYYKLLGKIDYANNKEIAKAIQSFELENKNSKIEKCLVITSNGEKYIVYGDKWTVNTELLGEKMKGSINEHNHVTGESQYSFSYEDLKSSIADGSKMSMAFDEKYRYFMQFSGKKITEEELYNAFQKSKDEVDEINFQHRYFNGIEHISDENVMHEVVKRTCKELGIVYGRTKNA